MVLLIDNYDSFSYNLYQMVGAIAPEVRVVRNDAMTLEEIAALAPERVILSPGPGRPEAAGVTMDAVALGERGVPVLGVCLGHQAIVAHFGGVVTYAARLMHGKQSEAALDLACPLFAGLPARIPVARYHSLAADPARIPACLRVVATTDEGEVMAVEHRAHPIFGLQFHPESVLTPSGAQILRNFMSV